MPMQSLPLHTVRSGRVVGGVGGRAGGTLKMDIYSPDVLENASTAPFMA